MRKHYLNLKLFLFSVLWAFHTVAQSNFIGDTIYREGDLHGVLGDLENDKMLQLERMTALAFHQTLNEYRAQKGRKTIFWDDKLWLAARNHTVYLFAYNTSLSHNESKKGDWFTGREPEDRVFYVTYGSRDHAMTGFENCASSGEMVPGPIDMAHAASLTYEEMLEQARFDAAEMFDLWKHSPGHNQNMLDAQHLAHGTSIIYNHATGSTYATSVFTQVQQYYSPDTLTLAFHPGWESDFKVNYKENFPDYKPYPQGMNRMSFKYFSSIVQEMNKLGCQPDERLHELSKVSPANESQRDLKKRFLKSTYYLGIFKLMKYTLQGQYFEKTYSQDEFYTLTGVNDLKAHLVHTSSLRDADFWGGTFDTKESGSGQTKVTFRTLTLIPKK